jgi:protein-S-isoprenylcysteine O-methyltransferase Ste14
VSVRTRGAAVVPIPPPAFYGAALGAGVLLQRVRPFDAVAALVTTGVYRFSRNPMYTGLAIMVVGAAMLLGTWWPIVLLPFALISIRTLVIAPEERYLAERFEQTYRDYHQAVRRWL